jgi:hypothetical protein
MPEMPPKDKNAVNHIMRQLADGTMAHFHIIHTGFKARPFDIELQLQRVPSPAVTS